MKSNIEFISAGAGSGKTFSLTKRLNHLLVNEGLAPAGVIATTFTVKAAYELQERVSIALIENGNASLAHAMGQATIGTVNSICGELLKRFCYEAGLSPNQKILDEKASKHLFSGVLDKVFEEDSALVTKLNEVSQRFGSSDGWREQVREIVNLARINDIAVDELSDSAQMSSESLLGHFRKPTTRDLKAELLNHLNYAIVGIGEIGDTTNKTKSYLQLLNSSARLLKYDRLPWSDWVKLSKEEPGKKSVAVSEPVRLCAGQIEIHPKLQSDIESYIELVFKLAADSLELFQETKRERGYLDFVDQEQRLYKLLDVATVKSILQDELQLLMVDEFQDTSPLQLALFTRLASLADRTIWVGDLKQAIFGFRGSDPKLMASVLESVNKGGGKTTILDESWRSRPALVNYCNQVFGSAFENSLPLEQIVLKPALAETLGNQAVISWNVSGNLEEQLRQVASGIRALISSGHQIVDKTSKLARTVQPGDIAVLCRSRARLTTLAQVCGIEGLNVSYTRPGLLATPEAALALASFRYMLDVKDTLAIAEIFTLALGQSVEQWLPERLQGQSARSEFGRNSQQMLPILERLDSVRSRLSHLTPAEAFAEAMSAVDLHSVINLWGPTQDRSRGRLANLDALLSLVSEYESQSQVFNAAVNVSGLIPWFKKLQNEGEDFQATRKDRDVVTLSTYHGAKGLEWPVVIAFDQNAEARSRLWGVSSLKVDGDIDVENPLKDRKIKFWPYPFAKQKTKIDIIDKINMSEVGVSATEEGLEEEKRMQYVAFTRARDLLVLPVVDIAKSTVKVSLNAHWIYPETDVLDLPDGSRIPTGFSKPADLAHEALVPDYHPKWFDTIGQKQDNCIPRKVQASSLTERPEAKIIEVLKIGERMALSSSASMVDIGSALHAIIAADLAGPSELSNSLIKSILATWAVADCISDADAQEICSRLKRTLSGRYDILTTYVEYPISTINEAGQEMTGYIDLLLETTDGWVIVDHKASPQKEADWDKIAKSYSGQLGQYRAALVKLTEKPVLETWIHFAVTGGLVAVS